METEKLELLKSLQLLDKIPEKERARWGQFLKPLRLEDGDAVFEEGSRGDSLFFVSQGRVRISKALSGKERKDLAILNPGDCFGEMALLGVGARSARAEAKGPAVVFEMSREDLNRWIESNPDLALGFFGSLIEVQSRRLRRTSNELTMLFDLSNLLLEPVKDGQELLSRVLGRLLPYLEGSWSAAAYLYNPFNDEMDLVAASGDFDFAALAKTAPSASSWLDPQSCSIVLPGPKRPYGHMLFHTGAALSESERAETGRTLETAARLLTSALENLQFRQEETLRARLKKTSYGANL
ncbi:MAG: cyclic nucleotide-binding domain-containing protein [Elusimicrobia bacterium]|nr:cyclic nucleotide-binding domain-containing protein [Elusimicrobiota bacterium]